MNMKTPIIGVTSAVVILSRVFSSLLYLASGSGKTALWNNWFLETFDEYQLGIILVVVSIFIRKNQQLKRTLVACGLGLLNEEANQVLSAFSDELIPYQFNSGLDFLMTGVSLLVVTVMMVLVRSPERGGAQSLGRG